ncbi:hypothetical protein [Rhizorhabdus dicambivorans]|nr:hypothetical protein [Rhizorhabdus dicambivorans]
MTKRSHMALVALLAFTLPAPAQAERSLASTIAAIDQSFICPQFLRDDAARAAEQLAFSRALLSAGPRRISFREANYIRARLLERHGCGTAGTAAPATVPPPAPAPVTALAAATTASAAASN